jgi:hypothetical protein
MFGFPGGVPDIFIALVLLVSLVRLVTIVFVRQQVRSNPSRNQALQERVTYRSTISARYRSPNSRVWPNHWYYPKGNPTEVLVHDSTFQISAWSFRRRGRHFGVFLSSAQSSMWQTQMRFTPFGVMSCIVVSGSYPFRGQDRPIEVAMMPRGGSLRDLWNALAASGVRAAGQNGTPDMAPAYSSVASVPGPPTWGTPPARSATSSAPPIFQEPTGAASYKSGAWQTRRILLIAAGLFIFFPIVISLILHAVSAHQSTAVSLNGSSAVATVSGASCVIVSGDLTATGNITATDATVNGLRITVQMGNTDGQYYGGSSVTTQAPLLAGESVPFRVVVPTTNVNLNAVDLCGIDWAAPPP